MNSPLFPKGGASTSDRRLQEAAQELANSVIKSGGFLQRAVVGPDLMRPQPTGIVQAVAFGQLNRVVLKVATILQLPRIEPKWIGVPLQLAKLTTTGEAFVIPSGRTKNGDRAPLVDGAPFRSLSTPGNYTFITDGSDWYSQGAETMPQFDARLFGMHPRANGTVNSAALQAAMTAASVVMGRIVVQIPGTYLLSDQVSLPDGYWLDLELRGGVTLDAKAGGMTFPSREAVMTLGTDGFQGTVPPSLIALPTISVNAVKGEDSVTLASAPELAVGDLVIIHDTTDSSFNPSIIDRAYYRNGEFKRVHSVAGSVVRFDVSLYDSYTVGANIVLFRVVTGYAHIHGAGKLICPGLNVGSGGSGSDVGIQVNNAYRSVIEGITIENAHFSNLNVWRCFDTVIRDVHTLTEDIDGNGSAGMFILSSYNVWVRGGSHQASKHGVSLTGGAVSASIPNRLCGGDNTTLRGTLTAADMHGHCDRCQWLDCTIEGGASIGGSNCAIIGGSVRSASDSYNVGNLRGMCIRIREAKSSCHTVSDVDCYLDHYGFQDSEGYPFSFDIYEAVEAGTFHVRNLRIRSSVYNAKLVFLRAVGRAVTFIKPSFVFENVHHFDATGGKTPILAIECLDDGGAGAFDQVVVARTSGLSPQTTNVRCKELTYDDFAVENSDSFGVVAAVVAYSGIQQFVNVTNVRTSGNDESGIFISGGTGTNEVYATVKGCKSLNNGQASGISVTSKSSLRATALKSLELSNNTFGDTQSQLTQGILYSVLNTTTLFGGSNKRVGSPSLFRAVTATNDYEELTFVASGSPQGVQIARPGANYRNVAGGTGVTDWVKISGTGATGWSGY